MNKTKVLSVASGKGGVGKTTLVANLAQFLADKGESVLLFDGDFGLSNLEIFYGLRPTGNLSEVLRGEKAVREILQVISPKISLISSGSGLPDFNSMNNFQRRSLMDGIRDLPHEFDWMIMDTAPGISDNVLYLNSRVDKIALILTPDPASLADSYALIKMMNQRHQTRRFSLVCNQVKDEAEGLGLYQRFHDVVGRFLEVGIDYLGSIPLDTSLRQQNRMQRLVLRQEPQSISAQAIRRIGTGLSRHDDWRSSGLELYWQQVVGFA